MLKIYFSLILVVVLSNASYFQKNDYQKGMAYLHGNIGMITVIKRVRNCEEEEEDECLDKNKPEDALIATEIKERDIKNAIHYLYNAALNGDVRASDALVGFLVRNASYKKGKLFLNRVLSKRGNLTKKKFFEILLFAIDNGSKQNGCESNYFKAEFLSNGYLGYKKDLNLSIKYYKKAYKFCNKNKIYHLLSEVKINKNGKK